MSKEILIKKKVSPVVEKAQEIIIKDLKGLKLATEMLSKLNKLKDSVIEEKEKITVPLNEALRAERARWKPIESDLELAIGSIRAKMTSYQTSQMEEQEKIAEKVVSGEISFEKAVDKMNVVESVKSTNGSITFKKVKKFVVEDIGKVPVEYLLVNETMVREAMKEGNEVKGIRYYEELVPINYR